ncbi:MAG TPA: acyltransferase [Acidocella sp.]|nr:acyltransferase [Acidocella sp.]
MSQKPDITDLMICRAVFAAWVFIYHVDLHLHVSAWLGPAAGLVRHGYMGVDGFFILSGLILMHSHREFAVPQMDTPSPQWHWPGLEAVLRFYGQRLARIYPVHLATILILLALVAGGAALGLTAHAPQRFGLSTLVQNLLLMQGWGGDSFGAWNYPSWSISTEWAGYLLFPLFACLLSYFPPLVSNQLAIITLPVLGVVYAFDGHSLNLAFSAGLIRFFPEFLAGMAAYRLAPLVADQDFARPLFLWGGVVLALAGGVTGVDLVILPGLWAVLFAFYMQADAQRPPVLGRRPVLHYLGRLSYCFYMSFAIAELLTVQAFQHLGWQPAGRKLLFAACMTLLSFGLASLLRVFVEQPCRRAATRWLQSESAVPAAAVTEKPQSLF